MVHNGTSKYISAFGDTTYMQYGVIIYRLLSGQQVHNIYTQFCIIQNIICYVVYFLRNISLQTKTINTYIIYYTRHFLQPEWLA